MSDNELAVATPQSVIALGKFKNHTDIEVALSQASGSLQTALRRFYGEEKIKERLGAQLPASVTDHAVILAGIMLSDNTSCTQRDGPVIAEWTTDGSSRKMSIRPIGSKQRLASFVVAIEDPTSSQKAMVTFVRNPQALSSKIPYSASLTGDETLLPEEVRPQLSLVDKTMRGFNSRNKPPLALGSSATNVLVNRALNQFLNPQPKS